MNVRHHLAATVLLTAAVLGAPSAQAAFFTQFDGTRADIRAACMAPGMERVESDGATWCIHAVSGITVTCTDAGQCTGAGPLAMRRTMPAADNTVTGSVP